MSLSSGSQKSFSSAGVRIRGALLSIGSRPYLFADLCQELDTASIPRGGVAPSATEQTCSTCPTIVPSELAERFETPINRTWFMMVAYSNGAPSGFRLRGSALSWRTAPSKHRGYQKSVVEVASRYTAQSTPAITATDGTLFVYQQVLIPAQQ